MESLIDSALPFSNYNQDDSASRIKANKLRARYLEHHADVTIAWTPNLADHLLLDIRESGKTLYIFELACYVEASYTACKEKPLDLRIEESFKL